MPALDPAVARLADTLRRSVDGHAWHGPSLVELLEGVDAHAAATRAVPGAHTIWELVLHLTAWTREVARRVDGAAPAMPVEGDWPDEPIHADEAHWRDARQCASSA
ncbi:DinB family protein, partial [Roseisolibacter sp. H3M3-2]|uniref:DinB family protein n=1 Tax=Roseisolibacter sp. H3M3-2 TaxID=3031323 RepID=UPI0023D9A6A6